VASTGNGFGDALRFEILGPLRAWLGDQELVLGPNKQRAVLATLLVNANKSVSTHQIVDAVWLDDPPSNGANVVQKYVAGLRRVLEPGREPRSPGQLLTRTQSGYLLRVAPGALDADTFAALEREAQKAKDEDRLPEATDRLTEALALWRGDVLAGLTGPVFDSARHRLDEARAAGWEMLAEIDIAAGRHRTILPELVRLITDFPFREQPRYLQMLALSRAGRRAEALTAYRDYHRQLADELGIEPGERVQDVHVRILNSDPALEAPPDIEAIHVVKPHVVVARTDETELEPVILERPDEPAPVLVRPRDAVRWPLPVRLAVTAMPPDLPNPPWLLWSAKIVAIAVPVVTFGLASWAVIGALSALRAYQGRRDMWVNFVATFGYIILSLSCAVELIGFAISGWALGFGILFLTLLTTQLGAAVHAALLIDAPPRDGKPWVSVLLRIFAALVPILTFGLGGWTVIGYYAARRRSVWLGLAALMYATVTAALVLALFQAVVTDEDSVADLLLFVLYLMLVPVSAIHGAVLDPNRHRRPAIPY
jgi:DNA-binding SARP family transcriptional activator